MSSAVTSEIGVATRLDRRFLLRHAVGQLCISEVYRTARGVAILREANNFYQVMPDTSRCRPFRFRGRRPTDADLWALVDLVLSLEVDG